MDIHHIRYFLAVSETLNFTRAAEACNVSQPALSRAVQQLEDEVGGLLFRRERNFTHLTDLGVLMKPRLQRIMDDLTGAKLDARKFLTSDDVGITIGIMCSVGPQRFTGMLSDFRTRYPGVRLRLVEGTPAQLSARLRAGEIDAAVMASPTPFADIFETLPLYLERFVIAFPTGHRFGDMKQVPIGEVDKESYLRRLNCEFRDTLSALIRERGCAVNVCYQSEREDWILNMVAGGHGICFLPEFSACAPGVAARPVADPEVTREVCLVSMAGRPMSPAILRFITAVKAYAWPESPFSRMPVDV